MPRAEPPAPTGGAEAACTEIEALYHQRADPFNYAKQVALYQRIKALAATSLANAAEQP